MRRVVGSGGSPAVDTGVGVAVRRFVAAGVTVGPPVLGGVGVGTGATDGTQSSFSFAVSSVSGPNWLSTCRPRARDVLRLSLHGRHGVAGEVAGAVLDALELLVDRQTEMLAARDGEHASPA